MEIDGQENQEILELFLTCHNIGVDKGELFGDPMELEMFNCAQGKLIDIKGKEIFSPLLDSDEKLKKLKEFEFQVEYQRMSVIIQKGDKSPKLYLKGNPEIVKSLCTIDSIPQDFDKKLKQLTLTGNRILAIASKRIDNIELERLEHEIDVTFMGFVELVNPLKPSTKMAIRDLLVADIHVAMITGDNLLTAAAVAKHCSILPEDEPYSEVHISN